MRVESYPLGICGGCRNALYSCKTADEKNESVEQKVSTQWSQFQLEEIKVPRTNGKSAQCPCPICHCARYTPIGMTGTKKIVNKPVINPMEDKMECEKEPPVYGRGRGSCKGLCTICGQIVGRGLCHPCTSGDVMAVRQGHVSRARSMVRLAVGGRK